jgi:RimJ/RimL family protein N-acetyltransferase
MTIALRPARPADADVMARWFPDAVELAQWAGSEAGFPLTRRHVETWIAERSAGRPRYCFTAVDGADAEETIVGTFQLVHDATDRMVRIARFGVAPERRGRGLGRMLLARALAMAFDVFAAHGVELGVWSDMARARQLYARAGLVHEGTARDSSLVDRHWRSVDTMSLLRHEWHPEWARESTTRRPTAVAGRLG